MRDWLMDLGRDVGQILLIMAVVAAPVALLLSHVRTQYEIAQTGYDIASVTREHRALTEEHKKLRIEAAVQGRTERMTTVARERFGLEPARPAQITIIEVGDAPVPAAPRQAHASNERF